MWGDLLVDGYFHVWEHFCVSYTANDDLWWGKYRQNFSLYSRFTIKDISTCLPKNKKEEKREKRGYLSASQHHYWIFSHW